jgi:hypothetical protein
MVQFLRQQPRPDGNLNLFGVILAQRKVSVDSLELNNRTMANYNASAMNLYECQIYHAPDGTLDLNFS